jgi:thymidylate synthase ThyX
MTLKRQVYLLDPQELPPETIAVTFAKTSRSPESFKEIAEELNNEKSAQFHEKWVVGYGHSSVAEHAVLHIAVENVSRLAVETLEGNRLASYTEKSTRYQKWDQDSFFIPDELNENPALKTLYIETNQFLFDAYQTALPKIQTWIGEQFPQRDGESESAWERRIRSKYVDIGRFFLPASALANVGMTINARALEHAIQKMLSHPLTEVCQMGEEIKKVSQDNVPTLVKYADKVPYMMETEKKIKEASTTANIQHKPNDWCQLVQMDQQAEKRVLTAVLYRYGQSSYQDVWDYINRCSQVEIQNLAKQITENLGKFDSPIRELEYANFTFDLVMDQGAFFEIKRHRMATQTAQPLTTLLGYAVPAGIRETGLEDLYKEAMQKAHQTYQKLASWNLEVASYVVPNAYNRRVLIHANFRSLDHLIQLRSAQNAHFSVRRLVQRMAEILEEQFPLSKLWLRRLPDETWQDVEKKHFLETQHPV